MSKPLVTILVPNYKTLNLTKLCLRLIRKYTDLSMANVIVIDNDSQDESLNYLRTLKWIKLIERNNVTELPVSAHANALDIAMKEVTTPYVLSIHTDTLVKNQNWLPYLLKKVQKSPTIAGVGSWKLESKTVWRRILKTIENITQLIFYQLIGKKKHSIEGKGDNYFYLRSHCAMYRMDLIKKYDLHFSDGDAVAGKAMHKKLVDLGYKLLFIPSAELINYIEHVNHATTVLNPSLSRGNHLKKGLKRVESTLKKMNAQRILNDDSLDIL